MARFGFVGSTYSSQSLNFDAQRTVNWYVEQGESGEAKSASAMYPTPGLSVFATLPGGQIQGLYTINGRCFAVSNGVLRELLANGNFTTWGNVSGGSGLVSMASNGSGGNQLLIVNQGNVYCFNMSTNTFQTVQPQAQPGSVLTGFADGYFFLLFSNTQEIQISALEDGTTWSGVNVAQVSVFPDNLVSMLVDHRELWLWGQKATQVYYNSGAANFPFAPIPGAFIEAGCAAINSPVRLDNSVFWLGQDERGAGVAWRAQGYVPARVSNYAIEYAWSQYPKISDAIGYSYQDQGHGFWVLYFPSANATWVYDAATQMWHERGYWTNGFYTAHRSQCHTYAFGKHLVGDWATGNVYSMSINNTDDAGNPIRRLRRAPHISTEQEWIFHHSLQIDLEVGLGNQTGLGINPQVMLRWSDDGAKTWGNEHTASAGAAGQYKTRVIFRRLGRSRDRVYELSTTDPIPWRVVDALLKASPDWQPQKRLSKKLGEMA